MRTIYHFLVGIFLLIVLDSFGQTAVLTGDLRYDNTIQSPLAGVPVHLKTLLGNIVASDTTDSSGFYRLFGFSTGNYVLEADVNYSWGGVGSNDALQVTRYFNSLVTLSPLQIKAGDVNCSNTTNSADALLISRRITGVISSFSVGNFTGNSLSLNALGSAQVLNLRVLSTGDVNKSYNPLPSAPSLELDTVFGNGNVGEAVVRFTNPGAGVYERGICWGNSPNPTLTSNKSIVGFGGFGFTHSFRSIDPNNIQYVRAYARTSEGVYYSNERSFTPIPGVRCPGTHTVTDIDGNTYNTVQIGNQCWTQSNLKTNRYRNGDSITTGLNNSAWQNMTSGAYAIYNNDSVNDGLYGKLYNHYAVTDSRGLCPTGWHVPSDAEWTTLENQMGGSSVAIGALKSTVTQPTLGGWDQPNSGATNSLGFTALPGGLRLSGSGSFSDMSTNGYWWSSSVSSASDAWNRRLPSNIINNTQIRFVYYHTGGHSVRCLKNTLPQVNTTIVTNVIPSTVLVTGEVISEGDQNTIRGFCYSTTSNPTILNDTTMNGNGLGVYSGILQNLTPLTTYYVRAYATNSVGTSYGNEVSFTTDSVPGLRCHGIPTVNDIDGNLYHTVQIGAQCWTQSNLKVSKYRNGDNIPTGLSNSSWQNTTSGAYAIYNNDPVNDGLYGKLYNHYAVTDSRGLCPTGWHVPTDAEWIALGKFLDPCADTLCVNCCCWHSSIAGGALKSTATLPTPWGWSYPNTGATNSSGFTAMPGGYRSSRNGNFDYHNQYGYWWSSSDSSSTINYYMFHYNTLFNRLSYVGRHREGYSVRCVNDSLVGGGSASLPTITTTSATLIASNVATTGGNVTADGRACVTARGVAYGTAQNPTISGTITSDGIGSGLFTSAITGLTATTLYYVRAYATNSVGTAYGNEVSFTTSMGPQPCLATPTVTDVDSNTYNTVQIGTQCWTQSNLKTSKYRNGDIIPTGLSNSAWQNTRFGAYAIYNNDSVNDGLYGKLYNHYAVTDSRGLCPSGWHVPTDAEWIILENQLGGSSVAGGALKSTAMQPTPGGWNSPNTGATNSSGFTALPGGFRLSGSGSFTDISTNGYWWPSTGRYRKMNSNNSNIEQWGIFRENGCAVRCLKNTLPQVSNTSITGVTSSFALVTGEVISEGDQNTIRGFCYSTTSNPTVSNDTTRIGSGIGVYSGTLQNLTPLTTYYVRAYATNSVGTSYGNEVSFTTDSVPGLRCHGIPTVNDIDGNLYHTVQIGAQCWTQSNLKVSKYRNGDNIPTGLSNSSWQNTTSGAYAIYNNDLVNDGLYGKLYNHYAVTDSRGLCPTGWHVPTDGEWTILENHLGGSSVAGGPLKSTTMQPTLGGWISPNTGATNSSGFTALPGGFRGHSGVFENMTGNGFWWSSCVSSGSDAWYSNLNSNNGNIDRNGRTSVLGSYRANGYSVRCVNDSLVGGGSASLPTLTTTTATGITSTVAITGGNVTADGRSCVTARGVAYGTAQNPTISGTITSNGTGTSVFTSSLIGLTPLTTYYVRAYATNSVGTSYGNEVSFTTDSVPGLRCPGTPTVNDIDGNIYNTVQIGTQCWTQSNLKSSRFRNGDIIPTGLNNSDWQNTTSGAYVIYNNDPVNDGLYGKLYNHYAVTDSRGLCPTGWHVPTDGEWNILVKYLDPNADTLCSNCTRQSYIAGGALKNTVMQPTPGGWNSPNYGATNSSGFTALPGGLRNGGGGSAFRASDGLWWSSSVSSGSNAWNRTLSNLTSSINRVSNGRAFGLSVRCLKD